MSTARYAIVDDTGTVTNVVMADLQLATDNGWIACPDDQVQVGFTWDGTHFAAPAAYEPPVEPDPIQLSPVQFKLLFTSQERVAIKTLRASDPVVDDFYDILDDLRLQYVDLSLTSTQQAVEYIFAQLVATSVLDQDTADARVPEVLAGTFN